MTETMGSVGWRVWRSVRVDARVDDRVWVRLGERLVDHMEWHVGDRVLGSPDE